MDLTGPNAVGTITNFFAATEIAPGPFASNDTQSVMITGTVSGDLGIATAGDLTINTGLIQSPGTVSLTAGGAINEVAGGSVSAGVLTGSAASATLEQPNFVGTLGPFATSTQFNFVNFGNLTVSGPVTDGVAVAITNNGPLTIAGNIIAPVGGAATVSIALPSGGGHIAFADLAAPGVDLVLTTGAGTATGQINVGSLLVIGSAGASNLFGSVAGVGGPTAAAISRIQPAIDPHYLLNNCVIEAAVCNLAQLPQFPNPELFSWDEQNWMPQLSAAAAAAMLTLPPVQVVRQPRDPDVELPNISNLDY